MEMNLRRKSKAFLLSLLVMCLIIGNVGVKAEAGVEMWVDYPYSIKLGETIHMTFNFWYEDIWKTISTEITLYFDINPAIVDNNYVYAHHKVISFDDDTPESVDATLSTIGFTSSSGGFYPKDGDVISLKAVCDWGNLLVTKGTLECYFGVNVYDDSIIVDLLEDPIGIGIIIGIVLGSIAIITLIIVVIILIRRSNKRVEEENKKLEI